MKKIFLFGAVISPVICLVFFSSCHRHHTLFELVPSSESGIDFSNTITDNDSINVLDYEYIYNGGGVAVGDFNRDGLPDLYFTGNMVSNRLYLNQGHLKFRDVTKESGADGEGKWCTGVAVVDINNDGWPDIYVCVSEAKDPNKRKNILYINQGLDKNGVPVFKDEAKEYGLDDTTYSTQAAFFDYDNDGDLDMFLLVNQPQGERFPSQYHHKITDGSSPSTSRLYRNDWSDSLGHPYFTNVSKQAGIKVEGYGLGVNITDINHDGWKDILVTNDFLSNDLLWINNHDGTFTDKSGEYFKHTSYSAMGNDVEDINNDGLQDVIALDMLPPDNLRKKVMMNPNNYITYINNRQYGYDYEYTRNTLQLNQGPRVKGNDSTGDPAFSEIAFLSGVAATDWSWTPLVADFDNDGYRDIVITNGFPKDVTDHDFMSFRAMASSLAPKSYILSQIPHVKLPNYAFHNNGNLTFSDVSGEWGLNIPSFSNGAVYADLDNDGDLDVVVNNINGKAFLFRNTLNDNGHERNHWLQVKFKGGPKNLMGLGTWVDIFYDHGKHQTYENTVYRGYLSSIENMAHFGLGPVSVIDSMRITWPNGYVQTIMNVKTDQNMTVDISNASPGQFKPLPLTAPHLFTDVTDALNVHYVQQEEDYIDFNVQKLLPHKLSQYGPALAVGDVDGNGTDDIFIGGSYGYKGKFLMQSKDGKFELKDLLPGKEGNAGKPREDEGALLFDVNNDGKPDLYIVSGSVENPPGSPNYQDRLYLNQGGGKFVPDSLALPKIYASKSCVKAADYDRDGDLDLFVGGRVEPGHYPRPVSSYILRNDSKGGKVRFTDVTDQVAPFLKDCGLVTDAIWTDFNNDGWPDLILVGEWMPVTFLENDHGKRFINVTRQSGVADQVGWWNSIVAGDFNNDGRMDYIVGNLGLNTLYKASDKEPVSIYAKDFDDNGTYDAIPTIYLPDSEGVSTKHEFPAFGRDDMIKQMIGIRRKFQKYHDFAVANIHDILTPDELRGALILRANNMQSCYLENMGNGRFKMHPLPIQAQFAPLYGMVADDFDGDGNLDLLCNGNDFGTEVSVGRYDALNGLLLKGDGNGNFTPETIAQSGIYIPGDGKALVKFIDGKNQYAIAASQNQGPVKIFRDNHPSAVIRVQPMDAYAIIHYRDGKLRKEEFSYGSSFLSQSGRFIRIEPGISSVEIADYKGNKRTVKIL